MRFPEPNRLAVYLTTGAGLATAVAVPLAELDTSSAVGVVGGLAAIAAVVHKWLEGWQRYEDRAGWPDAPAPLEDLVDVPAPLDAEPAPTPPRPTDPPR